ncbi:SDR family oxidoreductase [Paenibacillus sedimenti]|uniref:SDR family oxidoreductase n=1 Tax=Paenibacillus sedimenti TaxID=2770274 RepID=A0A926QIB5_9BACL|nr:SDR family oxidoreductase [Paenibacillus sedimenti]MBD0379438.1 SDR family oxidoreductase [Paenibacillus sedimenti]
MDNYPMYPYFGKQLKCQEEPLSFPPQQQPQQPGLEYLMTPRPIFENPGYIGSRKLQDRVAIVTGGDSGIGRAVSVAFAKEGADVVIAYLNEHRDADETRARIEQLGRRCLALPMDLRSKAANLAVVEQTLQQFGRLDIVVNNISIQFPQSSILDISEEQLEQTFRTNIFSIFFMVQAALPYLKDGSSIINTASILAYQGQKFLIDYSSTKGAVVTFTRSIAQSLTEQGIRVNAVAPGPIWTPLVASTFPVEFLITLGIDTPMKRAGQPFEVAPTFVYLASDDSRYVTGQTLHVNGGYLMSS